jgi:hypothetical protein
MRAKKRKSIKELEAELEQFIVNTGQSEVDICTDYIAYSSLKKRIENPDSHRYDDGIRRMKDLHDVYLLGVSIHNRQKKINAACKVAAAAGRRHHYCRRCYCHIQRYEYLHIVICIYFDEWYQNHSQL